MQGPPGSGKTYTGAHLIVLLERGHRVGVASGSHKAIHKLLEEVEKYAGPNPTWRGKRSGSGPDSRYQPTRQDNLIVNSADLADCQDRDAYQLVAGTAWLFCREQLDSALDYLFIDEAGQISLADALAMGTSARNIILLGDPLQLGQVSQAVQFLFSRNRLNVAISRARCLAVLVCSPELLHVRCRSAEQMKLVNALCRLVEVAREQSDRPLPEDLPEAA